MKLQNKVFRFTALVAFLAMLMFFVLPDHSAAEAAEVGQKRAYYDICQSIPHFEDCFAMQGMAVLEDYIYTVKKNAADTKATIFRTNRFHGETVQMTFQGAQSVDYLGHANDMCAARVGANSYLFVTTMKKSVEALACFKISGTELISLGVYNVYTAGGSNLTISGLDVYEIKGNAVTLLLAQGDLVFMGTVDVTAPAGNIYCPLGFQVDKTHMLQIAREACGIPELELTVQGSGFFNNTYYMPLTLHHNHATQIKADNHADSTSVIVAFPNISEAVSVMDRSVKASLSDTIYIPDPGEMFFEVESVDFADGIMYFSTNRVRTDHSLTTVSLVLDPDVDMGIFTRRASFRQDGIYTLSGASATDYLLYDPGADDEQLIAGKYPADIHTYFGLESNEEGFYYIRSMLTKEYLTVNADCTVTKSAKKENDPSQLFCLTQVYWPNEPGHVAIISLLNYQYLNNEAGTTRSITTTSGKTYQLKKVQDTAALESSLFDFELYTACYPKETAGMTEAQAKAHFNSIGKAKGYVASVFFDPEYYLANNPDVAAHESYSSPQGAYTHFVEYGFWEGRQGSLYYSINEYLHSGNDRLKTGDYPDKLFYIRHFRQYGANEGLTRADRYGSDEFAIKEIVAEFGLAPASGYEFLVDYISRNVRLSQVKTQEDLEALLFDWEYYIEKNPGLTESALANFSGSTYAEKLHTHWIQYGIKEGRIASPYFDAAFYRKSYTDAGTNNAEAYQHFLTSGFWAHRAGSAYYDGTAYLYGRNPEPSLLCPHRATVTATKAPTCSLSGIATTYCCHCSKVVKTVVLPTVEHTEVIDKAVAATCTAAGLTEGKHCSVCQAVIQAQSTIPATGHSYTSKVTTAATCTKEGVKTLTCPKCSHSYTEAIAATGHTPVTDKAIAATCTTAGKTEGSHCSVCNTVFVKQDTIPALGHDHGYTDNGNGTHTGTCRHCEEAITEKHRFDGDTCFCGGKVLTVDESIRIYHTLDLASDISVTFAVPQTALADYDSFYLECILPEYEGNTFTGISTAVIGPVANGSYYYFTLTGITAVRMGDMVSATLHMTKGTAQYVSAVDTYSVATYAYGMLNSTTDSKMLTLCADLLRYGAEAQTFKKYRTDALVDANMTDVHRSYLSNTEALTFTATDSYLGDLTNSTISWVGKTLDLGSKVGMKFVFNTKNYSGHIANLSMKVTYQGSNGETKTVTLTGAEVYSSANSYYSFTFYGLLASELRTIVDVAIYESNTQLSETLCYSAETYASKTAGTALEPLTRALFAYSDSAKAYFID